MMHNFVTGKMKEKLDDNNVRQKVSVDTNDSVERNTVIGYPRNHVATGDQSEDMKWGYGSFRPKSLQVLNNMPCYVIFVSIVCFIEGFAINGIANSAIPSLERQFKLPSTKSALIPSSMDIGALIVVLFVTFIGRRYNKASWVAGGTVVMAIGSFVFLIPHLMDQYTYIKYGSEYTYNCTSGNQFSNECEPIGEKYLTIFMMGNMLHGVGFTAMFTLGSAYIDDNESNAKAALYIGLTFSASAVGTAIGFLSGGWITQNYYVEFDRVKMDSIDITFFDPRWVGAWWVGFTISLAGFAVFAIPIFGYPKRLPDTSSYNDKQQEELSLQQNIKKFFVVMLQQIRNPIFLMITLAGAANTLVLTGVGSFAFKYLMEQYNLEFTTAGYLLAGLILSGTIGTTGGGIIIRAFHLELKGMLRLAFICAFVSAIMGISFIAGCPEVKLAGEEVPYSGSTDVSGGYTDQCQDPCQCLYSGFTPVCGSDNIVYFSSCHAGCTHQPVPGYYSNCSCVAANLNRTKSEATALYGRCDDDCDKIYYVVPCIFIALVFVLASTTPNSMSIMRVVEADIKPFALGVQWVIIRLLGTIPGPILVGWVIDNACLIFLDGTCGNKGNCLLYSHDKMALGIMIWWLIVSFLSAFFYLLAIVFEARNGTAKSFNITT